ncbi:MAG TPA: hypothetical protein DEH25_18235, partial [Chloroflexi bacterium]|nr:hypothetical protein [Chloroflexota bacterium]
DNGSYTTAGDTSWAWGTPTRGPAGAYSGANAWGTNLSGNYLNNEDGSLTSPAIDLSGYTPLSITGGGGGGFTPQLQLSWWQWLQTESGYDFASVEIWDGLDWTEVISTSGIIDTAWDPSSILLDPTQYAVPDFRVRFNLRSDDTVTYPGFYIDDVKVDVFTGEAPHVPCSLSSGGLVVGHVYDLNTNAALNGAAVTSSAGQVITQGNPDDPALGEGFYTLFAFAGEQPITAARPAYGPQVASPTVILGDAIRQDFYLPAGILSASPTSLAANLEMGEITTLTLSLENLGGLDVTYNTREQGGAYLPEVPISVLVPANQVLSDSAVKSGPTYQSQGDLPLVAHPSFVYTPPSEALLASSDLSVLLVFAADAYQIQAMLQAYPDLSQVDFFNATGDTPSLATLQAYDAVVVGANYSFADPAQLGNVLADYLDGGGSVVQTVPTFDPNNGWGIQGRFANEGYSPFAYQGDWFAWSDLGDYDPAHPIMDGVAYAGDSFRQMLEIAPESNWVASWMDDEFVVTKGSVVAMNTFLPDGSAWTGDIPLILHNSIVWLQTAGDVPWLFTDPITGTVPTLDTQTIQVTFDASVPEVNQPGQYTAALKYTNDSPYGALAVPVTMTVNAPVDWGRLTGTIRGWDYCDQNSLPLENATVEIHDLSVTTLSSADGSYNYWLPAGNYTVTVSAKDYLPNKFTVTILAGELNPQNVELRLNAPCSSISDESFTVTVVQGSVLTKTLQLSNAGAGELLARFLQSKYDLEQVTPSGSFPNLAMPKAISSWQSGPTSVQTLSGQKEEPLRVDQPLSGWFGALDIPGGIIRYASAQCPELPESYFVFGGVDGSFNISSKAWRYDTRTNTWNSLADLPWGGEAPAATCYQGKIYVMGGNGSDAFLIYDLVADRWTFGPALPRGVEGAAAAAWDGKIFLIGGDNDFYPGNGVSDEVNIFDIVTQTWVSNGASLPIATGNAGFAQIGPYAYLVGGWGDLAPTENISATQRYDLMNDTWELGPVFESARADFALAATSQTLYAIGGDKDGQDFFDATDTVESLLLDTWPAGDWATYSDSLPVAFTANSAGFCTQAHSAPDVAEVWSVGGLDTDTFLISGRTFFHETLGETCFSIYSDLPWISVQPFITIVPGGDEQFIEVVFNASDLDLGEYTATLGIFTNDPGSPLYYLPVHLSVRGSYLNFLPLVIR